ncbi:F-box protein [Aspergillus stella-maris]|uniref:F-box protein n=1 Tax=Aspergillus stella-maris TaxID=1810926 RepID=UPI003CCCCB6C
MPSFGMPPPCCEFCRLSFPNDPRANLADPPLWTKEVRAITISERSGSSANASLSGLGLVGARRTIRVPVRSEESYHDAKQFKAVRTHGYGDDYIFHDACWTLLLLRLGSPDDVDMVLRYVVQSLRCTIFKHLLRYGREMDHIVERSAVERLEFSLDSKNNVIRQADPLGIRSLAEIEASSPSESLHPARHTWKLPKTDNVIESLPSEVLHVIFSFLSTQDIKCIRLACQAAFEAANTLPQSYWRRRFALGEEGDFLFVDLTAKQDWRRLYLGYQACLREGDPALANRWRICTILQPLADAIALCAKLPRRPSGVFIELMHSGRQSRPGRIAKPSRTRFRISSGPREVLPAYVDIDSEFHHAHADPWSATLQSVLHDRMLPISRLFREGKWRAGISTVQIASRRYVCGIKFEPKGEQAQKIGYHTSDEEWLDGPSDSPLVGIEVAFCTEGLTGMRFHFEDNIISRWLGKSTGHGGHHGLLKVPEDYGHYALVAGLDRLTILHLGFGGLTDSSESHKLPFTQPSIEDVPWTPCRPSHRHKVLVPDERPNLRANTYRTRDCLHSPVKNIDFGGRDGQLLARLERIVVYLHVQNDMMGRRSDSSLVQGIETWYAGGEKRFWGEAKGCALSFLIDGPAGERITKVEVLFCKNDSGVVGLRVSTNHDRRYSFAPVQEHLHYAVCPMPDIPHGHIITGLFASPFSSLPRSSFDRIGIQTLPVPNCDQAVQSGDIESSEVYIIPDAHLERAYSRHSEREPRHRGMAGRTYITYAPLKHVKRISASTGSEERTRTASMISGLKIEYHHTSPAIILGQWIAEYEDNSFDLDIDERVQSVKVEYLQCRRLPIQQVRSLWIETSRGRTVGFCPPSFACVDPLPEDGMQFVEVLFAGDGDNALSAFAWDLDTESDDFRGVMDAETSSGELKYFSNVVTSMSENKPFCNSPGDLQNLPNPCIPFNKYTKVIRERTLPFNLVRNIPQIPPSPLRRSSRPSRL